jgi:hypothetical protein
MEIHRSGQFFDLSEFLERPIFAHLATESDEGPRESPVWFLWECSTIWLVADSSSSFPRRIAAEPRCALGFVDFDVQRGFLQHVGMRGEATLEPLNSGRLNRLLCRYLGEDRAAWNEQFQAEVIDQLDRMIRFEPRTVVMRDQSYFK